MVPDWAGYQRFRDSFAEIIDPAEYPIEWLDRQILNGLAWPIIGEGAGLVVEVKRYPGGARAVHALVAAGDLQEIATKLRAEAEAWGRDRRCTFALVESREGWTRALKQYGYNTHQISVRKVL
jgi:hypothetical protein